MEEIYFFGDVHNYIGTAQAFLDKYKPEKVIWLGDFTDSFGDSPLEITKTAIWLSETLQSRPNDVFCQSNHDIAYRCPKRAKYQGWGFTKAKGEAFTRHFKQSLWDRFELVHKESFGGREIFFSHAGIHHSLFPHSVFNENWLNRIVENAMKEIDEEASHPIWDNTHGPIWQRWTLPPFGGINQIVGHTPVGGIAGVFSKDLTHFNLNCDCARNFVGKWTKDGIYQVNHRTGDEKLLIRFNGEKNVCLAA